MRAFDLKVGQVIESEFTHFALRRITAVGMEYYLYVDAEDVVKCELIGELADLDGWEPIETGVGILKTGEA